MKTNQEECNYKYIEKINKGVSASCLVCKDTPQKEEWEKETEVEFMEYIIKKVPKVVDAYFLGQIADWWLKVIISEREKAYQEGKEAGMSWARCIDEEEIKEIKAKEYKKAQESLIKDIEQWAEKKWKPIIADEIKNFLAKIRNN